MLSNIAKNLYCLFCLLLPHRKTVIFESGDNIFDNGFVFANYAANHPFYKKFKLVCIGKRTNIKRESLDSRLSYFTYDDSFKKRMKFLKYSIRAKYIFFSYDNYWKYFKLRKNTKIFFIRHGAFPIKSVKDYYDSMFNNKNHYYVLSTTPFVKKQLEDNYPYSNVSYFLCGMPRCDLIKKDKSSLVFEKLGINKEAKLIIIATTFRHFDNPNISFFNDEFPIKLSNNDIKELNKKASEKNIVLIFKLHHAQFCNISDFSYSNLMFIDNNLLEENNLNNFDLFNASSALVTDYSGIFMDYLLTNKPLGFILNDMEKYNDKRGFTISNFVDYLPGEKILSKEKFFSFVLDGFNEDKKFINERSLAKTNFIGEYENCSEKLTEEVAKL